MKTIPPVCPEPETGRKYWRSLDHIAETPEFRQWMEREFPAGASEWEDPVSRRHFVKIMSASFLLAGLGVTATGCRRPEQKILPFAKMPQDYVHGVPEFYASAIPSRGSSIPLVVKSTDGRPIKIEGNPGLKGNKGGTDRYAQASILNMYDPDRAARITNKGNDATPEAAMDALAEISKKFQANHGAGLAFLVEQNSSPSRERLQKAIAEKMPQAGWFVYEAVDLDLGRRAASAAFGRSVRPRYNFEAADIIVSLDCDFIGSEEDAYASIGGFSKRRHLKDSKDEMNRLYVAESVMTLTGINADHRLRLPAGSVAQLAAALGREVFQAAGDAAPEIPDLGAPAGLDAGFAQQWIKECAKDLASAKGKSLVVAGYRQPLAVHLLAHALNSALGNVGHAVIYHEVPEAREGDITELAQALSGGKVDTLVILGGNPVYNAPADLNWAVAQRKAKTVVRLGYYEDETFGACDWHFPQAHFLESWGDARTGDGTVVPIQPLMEPLFNGWNELEILARIAGEKATHPYEIAQATFATFHKSGNVEEAWKKFLHDGFLADSGAKPVSVSVNAQAVQESFKGLKTSTPGAQALELVFCRDYSVDDGRYSNNGWLQEMPDPITKMVWDNAVLISRKTARDLQVENGQIVEIKVGDRTARGAIWVQPGQADNSLGLPLGYGRECGMRIGRGVGFNFYPLRTTTASYIATGATIRKTGEKYAQACTQDHWSMEGRPIIREATKEQYEEHPDFAQKEKYEEPPVVKSLYPNPFEYWLKKQGQHQWGMSIDLNMCIGCQACMMACQSENNVPIVGKEQVRRGREMHWIRIDRYYAGPADKQD
ncbi:MAG TPA: TAT-variant-translocated molybdopterin oxidoreductase, partial [Verrucomicrobiae bacterium]|nr:TAT-variant-translocated molybdopterin oxidoreductase [Verrucomicrobiae bacterium]